jgi:D-sedoheptulose 7-phosphate isomerase
MESVSYNGVAPAVAVPAAAVPATEVVRDRLRECRDVLGRLLESECVAQAAEVAERIVAAFRDGNKVIFFGNGGSSMDAGHLAAEMLGRFYYDRPSLPAISLPDSTAAMTAISNDYSYGEAFSRQLHGVAVAGDIAIGLSTSGNSENVLRALEAARASGVLAVALTGATGGKLRDVADICIRVPTDDTPRVQEACLHLGHTICEIVERRMFPREA